MIPIFAKATETSFVHLQNFLGTRRSSGGISSRTFDMQQTRPQREPVRSCREFVFGFRSTRAMAIVPVYDTSLIFLKGFVS
jgi:hypothetical protein